MCTFYEPLYFQCKILLLRCIETFNLVSGHLSFSRCQIKQVVLERKNVYDIKQFLQVSMVWFNCVFCKTMENFHCLVLGSPSLLIDSVVEIFKGFYFIHRFPGTRCLNHVIQSRTKRKMDGQATSFSTLGDACAFQNGWVFPEIHPFWKVQASFRLAAFPCYPTKVGYQGK